MKLSKNQSWWLYKVINFILKENILNEIVELVSIYFSSDLTGDEKATQVNSHLKELQNDAGTFFREISSGLLNMFTQVVFEYLNHRPDERK